VLLGLLLLAVGLGPNYLFERYNGFQGLGEFAVSDIVGRRILSAVVCISVPNGHCHSRRRRDKPCYHSTIATACFRDCGSVHHSSHCVHLRHSLVATGADRLGECTGLDQAAASSNVIPESKVRPGHPAVGCARERRAIFLSYYNDIFVSGVTNTAEQQRVLDAVAEHFRQAQTHPVQVMFYEKENWSVRKRENGATFGSRAPQKLIQIVNLG
jgi:hypothetical protein